MTKLIGYVIHSSKEYVCVMQLHRPVPEEDLRMVLREFTGTIYQKPPLRSSAKRIVRKRNIYELELLEYRGTRALLRVNCDAGTYMRKLCWDIGLVLGVGAHMRELRRTRAGPLNENLNLVRLHDLSEAIYSWKVEGREDLLRKTIMPGEILVCQMPKIVLRDTAVESIVNGAKLAVPGVAMVSNRVRKGELTALLTLKGELVAVGKALMDYEELLKAEKGIAVEPVRVILEPGLYPRAWKRSNLTTSPS